MLVVRIQPSTFAISTSKLSDQKLKKACLTATVDVADTKKLNLLNIEKRNEGIEKLSQTIVRQERPVSNKG